MIKVFNNLNTIQSVRLKDRENRYYTIFIESRKSTDIENYQITKDLHDKLKSGSLVDITPKENISLNSIYNTVTIDSVKVENSNKSTGESLQDLEETSEDLNTLDTTEESSDSSYTCEICGSEFASKRGLELHKSRSHKSE